MDFRGGEEEREEHDERTQTRYKRTPTYTFRLLLRVRITHPNLVTQQARPKVVAWRQLDSKPNNTIERVERSRLVELKEEKDHGQNCLESKD